ncbi:MAG TPA: hypothetical protein VF062_26020 [Candidatus Limnocylindrales bacterium]
MDDLRLVDRIQVEATGLRSGSGALTLGQLNVAKWVGDTDHNYFAIIDLVLHLPRSVTLDDLAEAFSLLMARNESLRTRFTLGPEPRQHVALTGEFPVDIYEYDPAAYPQIHVHGADGDTRSTISPETRLEGALIRRLRETALNIDDVLARAAVAVSDGRPVAAAMVFSHLIADFRAKVALDHQFTELAADPANRHIGTPAHQPLDQAVAEQDPQSRRRAERSLRFWEANLRWMPQAVYAVPVIAEPGPPLAGWLFSPPIARVLSKIEARLGTGGSQVITAALAAVLALRTDTPRFGWRMIGSNRIGARLHDYVGTMAQDCLVLVDAAVPTFDDLVRQCTTAILRASRLGPYDTVQLIAACKVIERERGILMHRDAALNDISKYLSDTERTAPEDIPEALLQIMKGPESVMHWWDPPVHQDILTEFRVFQFGEMTALGLWTWDPSRLPPTEIEAFLRGTERLILAAAEGNVDMAKLSEVTGLVPVVRDPATWLLLDSCWVEVSEVQRLLDDALAPSASLLHVGTGADGQPSLIAYLAAGDHIRTPDQAHTACLGTLSRRYTAMTPGWYVICDGAPNDPLDLAAWQRQPVLAAGDGRAIAAD